MPSVKALQNPFVNKSISADSVTGLWPNEGDGRSNGNHLLPQLNGFVNYMVFSNTPTWQSLIGLVNLFHCYHNNPVLFATIMIKAREYANMQIKVVSRSNPEMVEPASTRKTIPAKIYALFNQPNVLQSKWEFFMQRKIFEEVAGNSFTYGNFALGFKSDINSISALWNVWPAYMKIKLSGKYFEATKIEDVISQWQFELGSYKKTWNPNEIMHKNKPNTSAHDGLIFGRSTASSLTRPLTNIEMAYESRNVMMANRGMRVMLTSDKGDASGTVPLQKDEKTAVEDAMKHYGMRENQSQFFFSPMPLKAVNIDQDVMKLGLFEEIATDAMMVANAYGVPEVLLKLYIKGATFENQEASVRRLYQGTLIPEAEDDMIAFNNFLGLTETDWMILPDFSHVAALQESEKEKSLADRTVKDTAMNEYARGLITMEEYREKMGYPKMPKGTLVTAPVNPDVLVQPNI